MKRTLLSLLLLACLISLGACMFMGSEDREFYGKGWVNPKELDRQPTANLPMRSAPPSVANHTLPTDDADPTAVPGSNGWGTPAPVQEMR